MDLLSGLELRPATDADIPDLLAVQRAADTAWFGEPEHDEAELREWLDRSHDSRVASDGDRVLGFALTIRSGERESRAIGGQVVVLPGSDAAATALFGWLADGPTTEVEAYESDAVLRQLLDGHGWAPLYSSYEMFMPAGTPLDPPQLPEGVEFRPLTEDRRADVHQLVYVDAGWAQVEGHHERTEQQWEKIFLDGRSPQEAPVVAWRGDRPVAVAVLRVFSDGTGWIAQLAVAGDERRGGLGSAVLREAFGRMQRLEGVTTLGLAVIADNRKALNLYLKVGLAVRREWISYGRPTG